MRIEIRERGSDAFYKEIVNVMAQNKRLKKNPERKLSDYFKVFKWELFASAFLLVALIVTSIAWGFDAVNMILILLLAVSMRIIGSYYFGMKKYYKGMIEESGVSILTLDETEVNLDKVGSQGYRMTWGSVAFVRVFKESVCFVSNTNTGMIIGIERKHEEEILSYLRENVPSVKIIA